MSTPTPPPPPHLSPVPLGSELDSKHDTGEMPVIRNTLHSELNKFSLKVVGGFVVTIVVATVSVIAWVDARAEGKAAEVVKPIAQQVKTDKESVDASIADLTKRMDKLEERQDANHREQTGKLDGIYQFLVTKQPQPAFEKKPDGGTP